MLSDISFLIDLSLILFAIMVLGQLRMCMKYLCGMRLWLFQVKGSVCQAFGQLLMERNLQSPTYNNRPTYLA
jgi:hypothetical protein